MMGSAWFAQWFDALEGRWQLRRRILDLSGREQGSGRLVGVATFTRIGATTLAYLESGELVLRDGTQLKAVRRYLYRLEEDDGCVIEFADGPDAGRRYLRLSPTHAESIAEEAVGKARGSWTVADDHLCGRDLYQAEYRFLGCTTAPSEARSQEQAEGQTQARILNQTQAQPPNHTHGSQIGRPFRTILQRTVVSGPRKDYAIVSRLQR